MPLYLSVEENPFEFFFVIGKTDINELETTILEVTSPMELTKALGELIYVDVMLYIFFIIDITAKIFTSLTAKPVLDLHRQASIKEKEKPALLWTM